MVLKIDPAILKQRQSMDLESKVNLSRKVITDWYEYWHGNVYVSFSGGKDSTVLLHIVRELYPRVPAVFVDTGLEYPEIREFVKSVENVTWLRPKMPFKDVVEKYGFPVVSKGTAQKVYEIKNTSSAYLRDRRLHGYPQGNIGKLPNKWFFLLDAPFRISSYCCNIIKKRPIHVYEKENKKRPMVGLMASDSNQRKISYLMRGCNALDGKHPVSNPIAFWLMEDIWIYIKNREIPYSKIYDMGYTRTGCMFCMFGVHRESHPNRFELMKETHPAQYNYCINKLRCGKVLDFIGVSY